MYCIESRNVDRGTYSKKDRRTLNQKNHRDHPNGYDHQRGGQTELSKLQAKIAMDRSNGKEIAEALR